MECIIKTTNLVKKYPNKLALDKVSINVYEGDIYGLIGKNGAGKTTLMKLILGLINKTEGDIKIYNSDNLDEQRRLIGSLIEAPGLYKNKTAFENMKLFSYLYNDTDKNIRKILEVVGLDKVNNRKVGSFSLGMKQRLGIALAMLGNPKILILDEPINGLDPAGIKDIRDTIVRINKEFNTTIIISSHLLDELSKIVTRYAIISDGKLKEEISSSELLKRCIKKLIIKTDNIKLSCKLINELQIKYELENDLIIIKDDIAKAHIINKILVNNGINVYELRLDNNALEDYFIERIGR